MADDNADRVIDRFEVDQDSPPPGVPYMMPVSHEPDRVTRIVYDPRTGRILEGPPPAPCIFDKNR